MRIYPIILGCLIISSGCSSEDRNYRVKLVLPNQYRGLFKVKFDPKGEEQILAGNAVVFRIPQSGVLVAKGENPFLKWGSGLAVVYENGNAIDCAFRQKTPAKDAVLFRSVGGTNDGKEYWAVIGTEEEARKASLALGDDEDRRERRKTNR